MGTSRHSFKFFTGERLRPKRLKEISIGSPETNGYGRPDFSMNKGSILPTAGCFLKISPQMDARFFHLRSSAFGERNWRVAPVAGRKEGVSVNCLLRRAPSSHWPLAISQERISSNRRGS